jgi:CSLREA domain-containing protein
VLAIAPMFVVGIALAGGASATVTFQVNSIADEVDDNTADTICHTVSGACTLRAATMQANQTIGDDVVINVPAGTYLLTLASPLPAQESDDTGDLKILASALAIGSVSIIGAGATNTIIDAGMSSRIVRVNSGRTARLSQLTLRNGKTVPSA